MAGNSGHEEQWALSAPTRRTPMRAWSAANHIRSQARERTEGTKCIGHRRGRRRCSRNAVGPGQRFRYRRRLPWSHPEADGNRNGATAVPAIIWLWRSTEELGSGPRLHGWFGADRTRATEAMSVVAARDPNHPTAPSPYPGWAPPVRAEDLPRCQCMASVRRFISSPPVEGGGTGTAWGIELDTPPQMAAKEVSPKLRDRHF